MRRRMAAATAAPSSSSEPAASSSRASSADSSMKSPHQPASARVPGPALPPPGTGAAGCSPPGAPAGGEGPAAGDGERGGRSSGRVPSMSRMCWSGHAGSSHNPRRSNLPAGEVRLRLTRAAMSRSQWEPRRPCYARHCSTLAACACAWQAWGGHRQSGRRGSTLARFVSPAPAPPAALPFSSASCAAAGERSPLREPARWSGEIGRLAARPGTGEALRPGETVADRARERRGDGAEERRGEAAADRSRGICEGSPGEGVCPLGAVLTAHCAGAASTGVFRAASSTFVDVHERVAGGALLTVWAAFFGEPRGLGVCGAAAEEIRWSFARRSLSCCRCSRLVNFLSWASVLPARDRGEAGTTVPGRCALFVARALNGPVPRRA